MLIVGSPWSCPGKDGDFYAENLVPIPLDLDGCIWNVYLVASRHLLDGIFVDLDIGFNVCV